MDLSRKAIKQLAEEMVALQRQGSRGRRDSEGFREVPYRSSSSKSKDWRGANSFTPLERHGGRRSPRDDRRDCRGGGGGRRGDDRRWTSNRDPAFGDKPQPQRTSPLQESSMVKPGFTYAGVTGNRGKESGGIFFAMAEKKRAQQESAPAPTTVAPPPVSSAAAVGRPVRPALPPGMRCLAVANGAEVDAVAIIAQDEVDQVGGTPRPDLGKRRNRDDDTGRSVARDISESRAARAPSPPPAASVDVLRQVEASETLAKCFAWGAAWSATMTRLLKAGVAEKERTFASEEAGVKRLKPQRCNIPGCGFVALTAAALKAHKAAEHATVGLPIEAYLPSSAALVVRMPAVGSSCAASAVHAALSAAFAEIPEANTLPALARAIRNPQEHTAAYLRELRLGEVPRAIPEVLIGLYGTNALTEHLFLREADNAAFTSLKLTPVAGGVDFRYSLSPVCGPIRVQKYLVMVCNDRCPWTHIPRHVVLGTLVLGVVGMICLKDGHFSAAVRLTDKRTAYVDRDVVEL